MVLHSTPTPISTHCGDTIYSNVTPASASASAPPPIPRLTLGPLVTRPALYVDNTPLVVFTPTKVEHLNKQRGNTLIMRFSSRRPRLPEIQGASYYKGGSKLSRCADRMLSSLLSLGNFSEKIISRTLATRMVNLLPQIADEEQTCSLKVET